MVQPLYRLRNSGRRFFDRLLLSTFDDQNVFEPLPESGLHVPIYLLNSIQPVLVVNSADANPFATEDQRIDVQPFNPVSSGDPVPLLVSLTSTPDSPTVVEGVIGRPVYVAGNSASEPIAISNAAGDTPIFIQTLPRQANQATLAVAVANAETSQGAVDPLITQTPDQIILQIECNGTLGAISTAGITTQRLTGVLGDDDSARYRPYGRLVGAEIWVSPDAGRLQPEAIDPIQQAYTLSTRWTYSTGNDAIVPLAYWSSWVSAANAGTFHFISTNDYAGPIPLRALAGQPAPQFVVTQVAELAADETLASRYVTATITLEVWRNDGTGHHYPYREVDYATSTLTA